MSLVGNTPYDLVIFNGDCFDDPEKESVVRWRSCANLLYSNWLNYFVYQTSPYDITQINQDQ